MQDVQKIIEIIESLAKDKGVSPTKAYLDTGLGKDFSYNMKRSSMPSVEKFDKLADYFGVSVDLLLGRENLPQQMLTDKENNLIIAYRNKPQMQEAVDTLLGLK